jgi:hypothetical protein
MGVSGFIEVVALTLWGYELLANMRSGRKLQRQSITPMNSRLVITPSTKVGDVLASYPQSLEIFVEHGFAPLRNSVLRRTMSRAITIEQACRREQIDMNQLLDELQRLQTNGLTSTPVVSITRAQTI